MELKLENFGRFSSFEAVLRDTTAPNGSGKTTLINAYLYALSGRVLTGFEPRKTGTPDHEPTTVILSDVPDLPLIRRTYRPETGTILYIGGEASTQTDFVRACAERGIDVEFAALCADANVLTNPALTSEDLRKLLVRADVVDGGEAEALRKEAADVRKKRKTAEQNALSNVAIPPRTVEPITQEDKDFIDRYEHARDLTFDKTVQTNCKTCGKKFDDEMIALAQNEWMIARAFAQGACTEAERLRRQHVAYALETQAIADAERLITNAQKARADVETFDARLAEIDKTLRELDANAVRAELPEGVELVTEATSKTGTSKSVCTLMYDGIPLKSVNRAKRIEICVEILDGARTRKGMQAFPIIVDNAESVQGLANVENLIRLSVG